ncbi:enoyl-CoA hydratase [Rossellomorea aquimaris]|uniref:enoyl-CoA hydratase n=1 Tax=Rossellomorea aquimaris TaxID=189382 RepID=UPI001CD1B4BF|nr:enoyl-CoA hydratase [Rossellomorea aquimaris]MCA1056488.1 enoyl-CoA hydratase [Rossellomorea aquimaris]
MTVSKHYETVKLHKEGRVARLKLNRPKSLNALDAGLMRDLVGALKEVKADPEVSVLVLTGEGKGFSSGGDIKSMLSLGGEEQFSGIMDTISELVMTLYTMPKVVVTGIHGAAAGLGFSLALASDYILCEEDSKLAMNFIGIGLIPDGGSHFLLQERLGTHKAKRLIWNGKVLEGQEALMKGLVDEALPSGKLEEGLERYISQCLKAPTKAMLKTKEVYVSLNKERLQHALELEKEGQWLMRQTGDHQEGITAFVEKRKPEFKGR